MLKCATIGHSNHPVERFLELLKMNGISDVVDVRSSPYSQFVPQYNRETLRSFLGANGVAYHYMGDSLGARHQESELLFPDGRVDFSKVRRTSVFKSAIQQVILMISEGRRVALMCAEKEPFDCHRFVLDSYALERDGVEVEHILEDGRRIPNSDIEKRLRREYAQRDLFSFNQDERNETMDDLYERRNKAIAYRAL